MFICTEYKAKLLLIRPNFTVLTPGKLSKGSVTTQVQLNSLEWHVTGRNLTLEILRKDYMQDSEIITFNMSKREYNV